MNTSIEKKKLYRYLTLAETIAASKTTIPVLSNILLEADQGSFSLTASNLETGIKITDTASVVQDGAIAVNGKKLLSIVRELPDSEVILATDEHNRLTVRSSSDKINAQFTVAGVSQSEFPEVRTDPEGEYCSLSAGGFKEMTRKVLFAISSDENKYSLTGVFMEKVDDTINLVGTDGKRLALVSRKVEDLVQGGDFDIAEEGVIIPRIVFSELNKYQFQDDVLGIGFSSNQIFFRYENVRLTSNLIEGKYPDYKKIIPGERESFLLTDRELLLNAIKRVAVLVDESYNQVKLSIMENRLVLSTQNPALGGAVEEIPIEYGGDQIDIALNFTYLVDCLKEIDSEGTKIDFENEERVVTVHGIGEQGYVNLIMPMKLNG